MFIGTDRQAFIDLLDVDLELPIHWYPMYVGNSAVYTPLEELPEDIQELYVYDPEYARTILAEEGYPDGLTIEYYTQGSAYELDYASLLADVWAKMGVTVEIKVIDAVTYNLMRHEITYNDTFDRSIEIADPLVTMQIHKTGDFFNTPGYSNPEYDALVDQMVQSMDPDERNVIAKELALIALRDCFLIPTSVRAEGYFWWPWIKNYYGETNVGDWEIDAVLAHSWIDEDLKTEMGY